MTPELLEIVALHLGPLHPVEKVLTLVLAFGPFVVLGAVITLRRRHDEDDEQPQEPAGPGPESLGQS